MAAVMTATRRDVNTTIGTEVEGITLRDLDQAGVDELKELVARRGVLPGAVVRTR